MEVEQQLVVAAWASMLYLFPLVVVPLEPLVELFVVFVAVVVSL